MWLFCELIIPITRLLCLNPRQWRPVRSYAPLALSKEQRSPHSAPFRSSAEHGAAFAAARSTRESNLIFHCVAPAKAASHSTLPAALSVCWYSDREDRCWSFPPKPSNGLPPHWKPMERLLAATLALGFSQLAWTTVTESGS